jgi:hypothetical protein
MTNGKLAFLFLSMLSACEVFAQPAGQPAFHSAAEACRTLAEAAHNHDVETAARILGISTDVVTTNDDAQDKADRDTFAAKYRQMHRLRHEADGTVILYVGAENWPFPFPLVEKDGLWRFDGDAGSKEILYRRIGRNEFAAMALCHDLVAAKKENAAAAQQSASSPLSVLKIATSNGEPVLIQGYYFRLLSRSRSGRFTLIAYPAEYRSSGVMTFVVTNNDLLYEKDLGPNSTRVARAMRGFKKDATWNNADADN